MNDIANESCQQVPEVVLDFMNTVHCEEWLLVASLLHALQTEQDDGDIDALLHAWVEHTVAHFAREEQLMLEYHFPPYPVHRGEHEAALDALRKVQSDWLGTRLRRNLERYIERDWRPWFFNHIATMDRATAGFLARFDLKPDSPVE